MYIFRHESELGLWTGAIALPGASLRQAVGHFWLVEGVIRYGRDRMLPIGEIDLNLNLGDPQGVFVLDAGEREVFSPSGWVIGLRQQVLGTEPAVRSSIVGARLRAGSAAGVLHVPMHELADRAVDVEEVLGPGVHALRERLVTAPTPAERVTRFEEWLVARLAAAPRPDPRVVWAIGRLEATRGRASVGALAAELCVSRRRMIELFSAHAGLPPKRLARLVSFRSLLGTIRGRRRVDWAEAALECGYSDQAHLAREFRSLAGCTPVDYLRRRIPGAESVLVP